MNAFLTANGPWSQLVSLQNIKLFSLQSDSLTALNPEFSVQPFLVPHRDEFSETAGFVFKINQKKILFIPDIDKWEKWERNIDSLIQTVDFAFLDGTFFKAGELPNRDMREVPHPFIEESMQRFSSLAAVEKQKIYFIHFNHTNPLILNDSPEKIEVRRAGFNFAEEGLIISLD